jgi:hypothetical protein
MEPSLYLLPNGPEWEAVRRCLYTISNIELEPFNRYNYYTPGGDIVING